MKGDKQGQEVLWVTKRLLFFRLIATGVDDVDELAYVQYMEVTNTY